MMNPIVKEVLSAVEPAVVQIIETKSDALVDYLVGKLTAMIPGNLDNALAETVKPQLKSEAKKFLLAQADKIDGEVG